MSELYWLLVEEFLRSLSSNSSLNFVIQMKTKSQEKPVEHAADVQAFRVSCGAYWGAHYGWLIWQEELRN